MNCGEWEERIALYPGGDLSPAEAQAVEQHVLECAGCQLLLSGLRQSLGLLREAHGEPVEAAHLAAVRASVLSELAGGYRPWWRRAWVYGMVVAAIVLLTAVWPKPPKKSVAQAVLPAASTIEPASGLEAPVQPPPTRPRRRISKRAVRERKPAETVLVKLESTDPDVVIYWIAENKGEPK